MSAGISIPAWGMLSTRGADLAEPSASRAHGIAPVIDGRGVSRPAIKAPSRTRAVAASRSGWR